MKDDPIGSPDGPLPAQGGRRCPLCGGDNRCSQPAPDGAGAGTCWCMNATISRETLARIPAALAGKACLCPRCAAAAPIA